MIPAQLQRSLAHGREFSTDAVNVGAVRDQQVDHVGLAALGGEVESRCAYEVVALDATAALQEELGEIEIATPPAIDFPRIPRLARDSGVFLCARDTRVYGRKPQAGRRSGHQRTEARFTADAAVHRST